MAAKRVLKQVEPFHDDWSGPTACSSPDRRWIAAIDRGKVLVWDLDRSPAAADKRTFEGQSELRKREERCLRQPCEKVTHSLDQNQLRDLIGHDAFDQLDEPLRRSPCVGG